MQSGSNDKAKKAIASFTSKINRQAALSFSICVHCGLCTESCHYYLATRDPEMAPAYKADFVRRLYKRHVDWTGRVLPWWVGAKTIETDEELETLKDVVFGRCTMCRRCTMSCPMGVDKALLIRLARGVLTEQGIAPKGVLDTSRDQWTTGNQMAVSDEDYVETIEWLNEELADEGNGVTIPLEQEGADFVYTVNPREVKYAPMSLMAAARIMHAAGESWTMPRTGWDNTNFGLFSGDNALGGHMGSLEFDAVERLRAKRLVVSECGHGFRATKWEAPNWAKRDLPFPIYSFLEIMVGYVKNGRIRLNKDRNRLPVTYHDPCNLCRSSGITEEPRFLLNQACSDFREMYPNRADNFCCTGGGGAMSMVEYKKRRLESARIKADQLRATGAKIVATACHNCVDGLTDVIRHYKLGMDVKLIAELVSGALVVEKKVTTGDSPIASSDQAGASDVTDSVAE